MDDSDCNPVCDQREDGAQLHYLMDLDRLVHVRVSNYEIMETALGDFVICPRCRYYATKLHDMGKPCRSRIKKIVFFCSAARHVYICHRPVCNPMGNQNEPEVHVHFDDIIPTNKD